MWSIFELLCGIASFLLSSVLVFRIALKRQRKPSDPIEVAFLHPFCNAGGGGERVLWMSIAAVQKNYPQANITIYGGRDKLTTDAICKMAQTTFGVKLSRPIRIISLWTRFLMDSRIYPRLTLLLQSFGMFIMGFEALLRFRPDVMIDTIGTAFSYPIFTLAGVPIVSYVHYPFANLQTLQEIKIRTKKKFSRSLYYKYYRQICRFYRLCGGLASRVMVNSSWTRDHLQKIWTLNEDFELVYPSCEISQMQRFDIESERDPVIMSLAQFRPEKNHTMQLYILAELFKSRPEWKDNIKLRLYGGCRDKGDENIVKELEKLAEKLGISESVEIVKNADHGEILHALSRATVGLHTMKEEHFGISNVEFMASGLITVAHNSGGPKMDTILGDEEGFLCSTKEEYALAIEKIFSMPEASRKELRQSARDSAVKRFDGSIFEEKFSASLHSLLFLKSK